MELTQEIVRELLDYNPETGVLTWNERDIKWFVDSYHPAAHAKAKWNSRYAGKSAFNNISKCGYHRGAIFNKGYQAHRIIWLYVTGEWPEQIDHENGIRSDNRWCNLRNVSQFINMRNIKLPKTNTSGIIGVHISKRDGKFLARGKKDGKSIHLLSSSNLDEAVLARKKFEENNGYSKTHGKR